jgi:hypothetical protein
VDQLRNSSRSGFLGAPVAAQESKEIFCVFRSVPQPGPWSVKPAGGELEHHVSVRDLLIVVDRDLQGDSGCRLATRRCPPFSAGVVAQYPPTTGGSNAECDLAELSISACKLSSVADVYLAARGAAQIMDLSSRLRGPLDGRSQRGGFSLPALQQSVSSRPLVRRVPELSSIDRCA